MRSNVCFSAIPISVRKRDRDKLHKLYGQIWLVDGRFESETPSQIMMWPGTHQPQGELAMSALLWVLESLLPDEKGVKGRLRHLATAMSLYAVV